MKRFYFAWKSHFEALLEDRSVSKRTQAIILTLILLGCLSVRLTIIDIPSLERTEWKEIDYIEISKNYAENGYNFFRPQISWPAEPPRTTAMELPLVPYAASLLYAAFGFNVFTVRFLTLCAFLLTTFYVFRLGNRELGPLVGLGAALAAAIMPLYHPFRHFLFSDPWVIALSVVALFHCAQWADIGRRKDWILAMASFSLAVALKLTPLYLLLPLAWIAFRTNRFDLKGYAGYVSMAVYAMILPALWYAYAYYLTVNSLDVFGIFQGHDKMQTFAMLSDPEWYKTMFLRLRWDILGGKPGILLCMAGVSFALLFRKGGLFFFYLIAIGFYFAIVAEGQLDAPYRQLTIIPPLAFFISIGTASVISFLLVFLTQIIKTHNFKIEQLLSAVLCIFLISTIFISNYDGIYWQKSINLKPLEILAKKIKKNANEDDKLVAAGEYTIHKGGYDLSPVLFYYANIRGWIIKKDKWDISYVHELIKDGATYFSARDMHREPRSKKFIKKMKREYKTIYENQKKSLLLLKLK
jgi:4-amino-4-deoxy-L-arabinose transferase-like glycosyltransferase